MNSLKMLLCFYPCSTLYFKVICNRLFCCIGVFSSCFVLVYCLPVIYVLFCPCFFSQGESMKYQYFSAFKLTNVSQIHPIF